VEARRLLQLSPPPPADDTSGDENLPVGRFHSSAFSIPEEQPVLLEPAPSGLDRRLSLGRIALDGSPAVAAAAKMDRSVSFDASQEGDDDGGGRRARRHSTRHSVFSDDSTSGFAPPMMTLPRVDTNCTVLSLIPTVNALHAALRLLRRLHQRVRAPYDDTAQGGHQLHRTVSDTNSKWEYGSQLPHPRTTVRSPRKPNHCLSLTSV
jgi:hypothetical protein